MMTRFNFILLPVLLLTVTACGTVSVSGIQNSVDCTGLTPTFTADVVPVFSARGCTASGCHLGSAPAGDLDLQASGNATTIYNNIIAAAALDPATDPSDPLNAVLTAEPLKGLLPHDGGDIFADLTDVDYVTMSCWIESGAANN